MKDLHLSRAEYGFILTSFLKLEEFQKLSKCSSKLSGSTAFSPAGIFKGTGVILGMRAWADRSYVGGYSDLSIGIEEVGMWHREKSFSQRI